MKRCFMENINQEILKNFTISLHSATRLIERFNESISNYNESLKDWKKGESLKSFYPFLKRIIHQSIEHRAFINNQAKMIPYYEKYGFDCDFIWLENKVNNMLLLFKKEVLAEKDRFLLLTVLPTEFRIKQAKKLILIQETKEQRQQKQIFKEYNNLKEQFGASLIKPIKDALFVSEKEKQKINEQNKTMLQKIDDVEQEYKRYLKEGFLDNTTLFHSQIFDLISQFSKESPRQGMSLIYEMSKRKCFWHIDFDGNFYTIFAKKTTKFGWLFNVLSHQQFLDIDYIKSWVEAGKWDQR